jgi:EmrB/QacA subfamily drug resistance transporter
MNVFNDTDAHTANKRPHYNVILIVLSLAGTTFAMLQSLVVPALPEIQQSLHTSESGVAWILTAYLLSASVLTPILGRVGDMVGKERVLVAVLVVLALGSLVSALAPSLGVMIAGRVIQGAGGGIFPLAFGIVRDEFPRERVAGGIGLISSLLGIGAGLGLVLPGVIVKNLSYHWLFWLPMLAVLVTTVLTVRYIPESPVKTPGHINWRAALLMSIGLSLVLIAVSQTSSWGWGSARTLGLIAAGSVVLVLWVQTELRATEPLIDMAMMRIRGVWTTNLVAFLLGVGMYSSFIVIPQFVETPQSAGYGFGASITAAGLFMLPAAMVQLMVGPASGRLERRLGSRTMLQAGTVSTFLSFLVFAAAHDQGWHIYAAAALLGLGIGLAFAALANLIVEAVRQEQTGVATGMNTVLRTLGGAFGGQVAGTFIANSVGAGGLPTEHGYTLAFGMCAGALAIAVLAGFAIPRRDSGVRAPVAAETAAG